MVPPKGAGQCGRGSSAALESPWQLCSRPVRYRGPSDGRDAWQMGRVPEDRSHLLIWFKGITTVCKRFGVGSTVRIDPQVTRWEPGVRQGVGNGPMRGGAGLGFSPLVLGAPAHVARRDQEPKGAARCSLASTSLLRTAGASLVPRSLGCQPSLGGPGRRNRDSFAGSGNWSNGQRVHPRLTGRAKVASPGKNVQC